MEDLKINSLSMKKFALFNNIKVNFNEGITEIYGKNKCGKSTIANAIAYAITGLSFWGKKYDPIADNNLSELSMELEHNGFSIKLNRCLEVKGGKRNTLFPEKKIFSEIDKDIYLSIINPEYFINIENAKRNAILLKLPLGNGFIDEEQLDPQINKMIEDTEKMIGNIKFADSIKEKYDKVCEFIIEKENEMKALPSLYEFDGMIKAYNNILNSLKETDENTDKIRKLINKNELQKIFIEDNLNAIKSQIDVAQDYKMLLFSFIVNEFNNELFFSKIENDLSILYNNKDIKQISSSEKILSGLDFVNAISKLSGYNIPVIIDNAECIQYAYYKNETLFDVYDNIKQLILLTVSDTELSIYDPNTEQLENLSDGSLIIRTREKLLPPVKFINF